MQSGQSMRQTPIRFDGGCTRRTMIATKANWIGSAGNVWNKALDKARPLWYT